MRSDRPPASASYHPHIDGLRAVAIALVLLYHFDFGGAAQGFLGVDIFFVISGFLIGGIIRSDLASGRFGFVDFYRRRVARIMPALLFVAAASLAAGYALLTPTDLNRFALEVRAAALNIANWHFEPEATYFVRDRIERFFLHSWSLSVEAQFYLAFPPLALLLHRFGWLNRRAMAVLIAASLAAYLLVGVYKPRTAFYFSSLRAWEFLAGVLVAAGPVAAMSAHRAAILALLGAAAMLGSAFAPIPDDFVPRSLWQILCVTGTVLLLHANLAATANPAARLLSLAPVRALGLISYSVYLIHWPLLRLAENWHISPLPPTGRLLVLLATLPLAVLGWLLVERPARRWANRRSTSAIHVYGAALLTTALVVGAASWIVDRKGAPERFSIEERALLAVFNDRTRCPPASRNAAFAPQGACLLGDTARAPDVAVWGDSHSRELAHALGHELGPAGRSLAQYTSSGCPPFLGAAIRSKPECVPENDRIAARIAATPSIKTVVLAAYYGRYTYLGDERMAALERSAALMRRAGKRVIITGPLPKPSYDVPSGLARRDRNGRDHLPLGQREVDYRRASASTRAALDRLADGDRIVIADPGAAMCVDGACPYVVGTTPLYMDDNHPSVAGAERIAHAILPLLAPR
jgi:peptidoglycan/LPS O-acetylase OafA/YrhL